MYILELNHITKKFISVKALDRVKLNLKKGEIVAVCGENGAGKSTLMKIISGSDPFGGYEGQILMDGEEKRFHSTRDAEKSGIEMIYQEISLHLDLSVAENLFMGKLLRGRFGTINWKKMNADAKEALALVGLEQIEPTQKVKTLSTSQQQLLSIARAILKNPRVLVLDEPTSALTQSETEKLLGLLKGLREKGVSCLYISHKLKEVFEIADRITVLRDGKYISTYDTREATSEKLIEDMVGRKINVMYPKVCCATEEELLRVEDLCVPHPYMKDKNIVDHVSFTLHKGEVLGLAGLVGAGRSELMDALFKVTAEGVTGKVFLAGKPVTAETPKQMKAAGMGYITEDRKKNGYIGSASIMENTTLASLDQISNGKVLNARKERLLAQQYSDLLAIKAPGIDTHVVNLSGGNQQKVILAKWMMTNLRVLLLDEPTRGIDVGAKAEIYKLINNMAQKGIGILMASSEMPELIAMCDRFLVLSEGKIRAEFTKSEVSQEKIMAAATVVH
ncbi:sugar ABC transporter ATP-binding protein [Christensenella tenuis]|uniref:Sugar ABC transporter ATP-binding protein n=1 Tax=Christensenella tenuis TaxID=2763033 RepID=A0ABR7EH58_9FIRM|nr:sugar ABC transporter ATP-binding protein [Christensenella tenuis]MBC5649100.1 sugar ABC transporter ATP-binding protein [Christensenella tenuis]